MDPDGNHWYITERRQTGHITPDTRTILPGSSTRGAAQFIEFMKQAFGAEEAFMHKSPSGTVIHSRIRIGDSILAIGELHGELAPMPFHMHMYVPNIDAVYQSALRAGAKTLRAPRDEPYGDRAATVEDDQRLVGRALRAGAQQFGNGEAAVAHARPPPFTPAPRRLDRP